MWDWSSDSAISEDPCLMWCDSVSLGKQLPSSEGIISLQNVGNYARNDTATHPHVMWLCVTGQAITKFWASNYQVLKASYPFKMLETTQGTTQHLTLMWRDSVSLGKQLPSSEGIISLQNVGNYARNDTASHPHVMWLCIIGRAVTIFWRHNNYLKLNERQSVTSQKMGIFVLAMLLPFNTYILYKMYANDPSYNKLHMPKIMVNLLSP